MLTAMSIAAVVCIASSNGGTTSQDLKTGYLVGATPRVSATGDSDRRADFRRRHRRHDAHAQCRRHTLHDKKVPEVSLPAGFFRMPVRTPGTPLRRQRPTTAPRRSAVSSCLRSQQGRTSIPGVPPAWYLAAENGRLVYRVDTPIKRESELMDGTRRLGARKNSTRRSRSYVRLDHRRHPGRHPGMGTDRHRGAGCRSPGADWACVRPARGRRHVPRALHGDADLLRRLVALGADGRLRGVSASEAETETSPGVLLASGYIAGGTLCGLLLGLRPFMVRCRPIA